MVEATKKRRKEEDAEYIDNLNKNCGERLAQTRARWSTVADLAEDFQATHRCRL